MTGTGEITVEFVRDIFREAGHHVPSKKRAQAIVDALPNMALATGWTEREVLDIVVLNYRNGAVDRLVKAWRDAQRRGQRPMPQHAAERRASRQVLRDQRRQHQRGRRDR